MFAAGPPAQASASESASASEAPSSQDSAADHSESDLGGLFSRINGHRTQIGCSNLVWHEPTAGSAQAHSDDMSRRRYFDHASPEGITFDVRLRKAGVTSRGLSSENLALTPAGPQSVMEMWMESPGHRRNLDNCSFTAVGIGERDGLWTAVFVTRPAVSSRTAFAPVSGGHSADSIQAWLQSFLTAPRAQRLGLGKKLTEAEAGFERTVEFLRKGRRYGRNVATGRLDRSRMSSEGLEHPYVVLVPETYDPERRYPVRVYLHGGISRPALGAGGGWWRNYERIGSEDRITVIPASWEESKWWEASQSENLRELLDELKRVYNVDENRVSLLGISDGGSGVYFHAMRASTPWASFLPYIGHPAVVNNPRMQADGEVYAINLTNKPLYVVNTENDRLYPPESITPYITEWRKAGADITFRPIQGAGHDLSWIEAETPRIDAFVEDNPRQPLPNLLRWETERTDRYNRVHWVEILALGTVPDESDFEPVGGLQHRFPSGRIDVRKRGNRISVRTRSIRRFRLLLSPDHFDFDQPILVVTNGRIAFEGMVLRDVGVLLRWAAEDLDRTMLFGAELEIEVVPGD